MEILNDLAPATQKKSAGATDSSLQGASVALDAAQCKMVLEEIGYDEQCLQVFQEKISNYQVKMMHLQDSWVDKQLKTAREAISKWWESNVTCCCNIHLFLKLCFVYGLLQSTSCVFGWVLSLLQGLPQCLAFEV